MNALLEKSIKKNEFSGIIEVNKICLMDYVGECPFVESISTNVGVSSSVRNMTGDRSVRKCSTLDSIFPDQTIDILKLDVEGAERYILRGATKLLAERRIRNLIIEYNHDAWKDQQEFLQFASESGFKSKRIVDSETGPAFNYHLSLA